MALKASELKVGDTYTERVVEDLKRTQVVMYAGASVITIQCIQTNCLRPRSLVTLAFLRTGC
ncbi:MAG: hypothetical protein CM1200mP9_01270 [Gammaproteobacteria bacterium]|nr:MAG: hypothetical protein CM1200mP9_01270 [Gammaproteobacteria bacterium]